MMLIRSRKKDRAATSPLDLWIVIQASTIGVLIFFLKFGLPGFEGLSVVFGAIAALGFAALVGMVWVRRLLAMVVTTYAVILFTPITNILAESLAVICSNTTGHAIVVLEGDPGYGRIIQGLKLFAQEDASVLAVTGAEGHPDGWRHYEVATLFGVRQDRLLRLTVSRSGTRGEVEALQAFRQAKGIRRIVLVTSKIHSLRATLAFEKAGFDVCSAPVLDRNALSDFFDPWGRVLMARDLVHELFGLAYYKARGWL